MIVAAVRRHERMIEYLTELHQTRRFLFGALWLAISTVVIYGPLKLSNFVLAYLAVDLEEHQYLYSQLQLIWALVALIGLLFVLTKIQERAKR